ncbi:hypothetical protein CANMA_000953 [Candida margitis]|uniref:uncharacterized protein n=1 Tax=Candida margitis TaxID=1775924 RepID=UPI0022265431|nr:uncharacterized protein CANMA_000953 [Candida margitis]KAI5970013.1 hypothetical protein CANMA_000953 [Candida margitis]
MSDHHPRGILRNKSVSEDSVHSPPLPDKLDRQEVIKNTKLNAQLHDDSSRGEEIRAKIAQKKKEQGLGENDQLPEHLKWDELNIYKNEQEKSATMKIDEPKTPYEGGFDPEGEYYKDDDDEESGTNSKANGEEIPEFELGEGEYDKLPQNVSSSLHGGEVYKDEAEPIEDPEDKEEEKPLTAEERHKKFEEKRKQHYHMKALPLKHKIDVPDQE